MLDLRTPQQPYHDPWLLPLGERLRQLLRGERRVAYYYEAPNNSTFRYRAYNMAQVLNGDPQAGCSAGWFHRDDLGQAQAIADGAQVLVLCRSGWEPALGELIAQFRRRGKPVLFDIDDLVFDTRYVPLLVAALGLDSRDPRVWDDWFGMVARMGATLRACDGGITTNDFLAERMREFGGQPVAVVPNFMNREQLAISDRLWAEKRAPGAVGDDRPVLAYFSGSPSHRLDFAIVAPALEALLERRPELRVMTVGYLEPEPAWSRFGDRVLRAPFTDWVNLQRLVASVEVNLMPLQASVFADCKSPLKFFEAAAVGTVSVASPTANHVDCIVDGHNGLLSRAHEWERRLAGLLDAAGDRAAMAARARELAMQRFACTTQAPAIRQALGWT